MNVSPIPPCPIAANTQADSQLRPNGQFRAAFLRLFFQVVDTVSGGSSGVLCATGELPGGVDKEFTLAYAY